MRLQQIIANIKKDKNNDDLLAHFNNGLTLLGLNPSFNKTDLNLDKEFIENMISRRQEAKKNKDFELADKIRDELFKQGIVLEDTKMAQQEEKLEIKFIFDTTLRDGQQTTGVDFSVDDKIKFSNALDELGLDYIEVVGQGQIQLMIVF